MESILKSDERTRYMMLSRLQSDCEYYLNHEDRNKSVLWSKDEQEHINNMKQLHNSFSEDDKPEWLTMEQILEYEKQMVISKETA
jgi:hypothetical protein